MAEKIPGTSQTVSADDIPGSVVNFGKAAGLFGLATAAGALGVKGYNMIANNTPDGLQPVEVI